eukprot:CAMPEP_0181188064 /NCGR_PEP_ID=MMETSP1096-20121128/10909_1 /TAXON_ID=156174 ORGANISM="Chrysochromulina ericina, Strain CCMP281" /NCGR_SAMPLE_ID=MMETSP1096 /ASSEMBLY_ACC=CAM_ASM_000453 /LENGTH=111 /DNA_ID=CAMNT_0023277085 /DNA_START=41 /DNA_END=376 /DNA_ORIENTATION=-
MSKSVYTHPLAFSSLNDQSSIVNGIPILLDTGERLLLSFSRDFSLKDHILSFVTNHQDNVASENRWRTKLMKRIGKGFGQVEKLDEAVLALTQQHESLHAMMNQLLQVYSP